MTADPLLIMADALERCSIPPHGEQTPSEYIRNDAFQVMAAALRDAVLVPDDHPYPQAAKCRTCAEFMHIERVNVPTGIPGPSYAWVHDRYAPSRRHPAE